MIITAQQPGSYKVKLTVTDQFGQSADVDKDIKVDSSLRPELSVSPVNVQLGNIIDMTAQANKNIALIEWDFGDGTNYKGTETTAQKEYKKS
jgi:PKD repeat protein